LSIQASKRQHISQHFHEQPTTGTSTAIPETQIEQNPKNST